MNEYKQVKIKKAHLITVDVGILEHFRYKTAGQKVVLGPKLPCITIRVGEYLRYIIGRYRRYSLFVYF